MGEGRCYHDRHVGAVVIARSIIPGGGVFWDGDTCEKVTRTEATYICYGSGAI